MYLKQFKFSHRWLTVLFSFALVFFMACEDAGDDTDVIFEEDEKSAYEAEESAENLFDVVESITNSAVNLSESNSGGRIIENSDPELACAELTFDKEKGRIEINFGDGCEGPDGKVRKGKIVIEYEGNRLVKGSKVWTVLQNFYMDDIKIEGTRVVTNVSEELELIFTVEIIGGKIIWPLEEGQETAKFLTRESDRTHKLIFGDGGLSDFEIQVNGEASGKTRDGVQYSTEIIDPLVFKSSCRGNTIYFPASGNKIITIPEKAEIKIDYGDGECNTKFTVEIDKLQREITM